MILKTSARAYSIALLLMTPTALAMEPKNCGQALSGEVSRVPSLVILNSSTDPLPETQILRIKALIGMAKKRIFSKVQPKTPLTLQLFPPGKTAHHIPWNNTIELSYAPGGSLFRATQNQSGPAPEERCQFKSMIWLIHEFAHSATNGYFQERIPEYGELLNLLGQLASSPEKWENLEFKSQVENLIKYQDLIAAYDELLSDLAVALFFDDPKAPSRGSKQILQSEMGIIPTYLFGWADTDSLHRDFSHKYEKNLHRYQFLNSHTALGPTRSHLWRTWIQMKRTQSESEFFSSVFDAILTEIDKRIEASDFGGFNLKLVTIGKGMALLQERSPIPYNLSLMQRLDQAFSQTR